LLLWQGHDSESWNPSQDAGVAGLLRVTSRLEFNFRPEISRMIDLGAAREEITRSQYIENLVEAAQLAQERAAELALAREILKRGGV
jgi:hypothetical protein